MPGRLAVAPTHGDSGQLTIHGSLAIGRAEIGGTTDQNGDFNYDGKINVDDYGIIDFNVGIQGPPLPSAAPLSETRAATRTSPMPPLLSKPIASFAPASRDRDVFHSIFSTAEIL